jgi:hypothetical protein
MTLRSHRELETTRKKLRDLEQLYAQTESTAAETDYARELTLRSLRRTINQLIEGIARFESQGGSPTKGD